ncbi:hypothetical protein D9619_007073 [Psilocybe cf. subviscida]|uniref:Nucleoside diphosphate kinase n=1 Tax=Psilocybe cf. subviscida TaxID=2480587 RepID=A0A8H5B347_9AGAR|nr:hypothetical protein D9619_007073 [Psilocybe cf. subviscida]
MSSSQSHSPIHEQEHADIVDDTLTIQASMSLSSPVTRTVAIIKNHALKHRFDIERRIQEASFEIVKERQMDFDTDTDPEALYDLFGEDTDSLAEGPVWVYVLERRRAVEVWNTLMGDRDVEIAKSESPNSLRALYGTSYHQNGLMGSPDNQIAEIQIASLFVSSPPFPIVDLPSDDTYAAGYDSQQSVSSSVLETMLRAGGAGEDSGYAASSVTNPSTAGGSKLNANGKPSFKARALPSSHDKPDIVPRMTKAAALRLGQPIEKMQSAPRAPVSKERQAQTFANVPGHKRASTISVASTAAPTIAPRMTKAASLRLGQPLPTPVERRKSLPEGERTKHGAASTFEGVPGHKRRESIAVASSKAPTVAPRLNKSAALRLQPKEQTPPTSFSMKTPTLFRATSTNSLNPPKPVQRTPSSTSVGSAPSRYAVGRRASVLPAGADKTSAAPKPTVTRPASSKPAPRPSMAPRPSSSAANAKPSTATAGDKTTAPVAPKLKPRPSSVAGSAPSIAPRTNRSAALRAAKKEAENAAAATSAAAAAARKAAPRPSKAAPPSSFKAVTA